MGYTELQKESTEAAEGVRLGKLGKGASAHLAKSAEACTLLDRQESCHCPKADVPRGKGTLKPHQ